MSTSIPIDKAGRVVIPKEIRDKMHLTEGARLTVELDGETIMLSAEEPEIRIERVGKRRVVVGWEGFDAAAAVRDAREEQIAKLEGRLGS